MLLLYVGCKIKLYTFIILRHRDCDVIERLHIMTNFHFSWLLTVTQTVLKFLSPALSVPLDVRRKRSVHFHPAVEQHEKHFSLVVT